MSLPEPRAFVRALILVFLTVCLLPPATLGEAAFIRGDVEVDAALTITDAIVILEHLFLGRPERLNCVDAADVNDDGMVNLVDGIALLFHLFEGESPPPAPHRNCGPDGTEDDLGCDGFWICGTGELTNLLGMKLLWVPPGEFQMGSPSTERGRFANENLHPVELSCGFYMGATEVTQGEYLEIMGENPSYANGIRDSFDWGTVLTRPVETVSWIDAMEFCRRLSAKDGRRYRLPTEAEWEYACRAGTRTRFWFGDILECPDEYRPNDNGCPAAAPYGYWGFTAGFGLGLPVGQKIPNPFGFYEMHGRTAEWCIDWYGPYPKTQITNPAGPPTGTERVFRGTVLAYGMRIRRSAARIYWKPDTKSRDTGFRVVLEMPNCDYGIYPID